MDRWCVAFVASVSFVLHNASDRYLMQTTSAQEICHAYSTLHIYILCTAPYVHTRC